MNKGRTHIIDVLASPLELFLTDIVPAAFAVGLSIASVALSTRVREIVSAILRRPTKPSVVIEVEGKTFAVEPDSLSKTQYDELSTALRQWQDEDVKITIAVSRRTSLSKERMAKLREFIERIDRDAESRTPAREHRGENGDVL